MEEQKSMMSEFAIASLVMGIVSFFNLLNLEKPIVAVVFGALALKRIRLSGQRGKKLALTGMILGVLAIILIIVFFIKFFPQLMMMRDKLKATP